MGTEERLRSVSPQSTGGPDGSQCPRGTGSSNGLSGQRHVMCLVGMRAAGKSLFAAAAAAGREVLVVDLDRFIEKHFLCRFTQVPDGTEGDTAAAAAGFVARGECSCPSDCPPTPFCCVCVSQRRAPDYHQQQPQPDASGAIEGCICLGPSPCRSVAAWCAAAFPVHCSSRQRLVLLQRFAQRFGVSAFRSVESAALSFCLYMAAGAALPVVTAGSSSSADFRGFRILKCTASNLWHIRPPTTSISGERSGSTRTTSDSNTSSKDCGLVSSCTRCGAVECYTAEIEEQEVLQQFGGQQLLLLACGGGVLHSPHARQILQQEQHILWVKTSYQQQLFNLLMVSCSCFAAAIADDAAAAGADTAFTLQIKAAADCSRMPLLLP